MIGIIDYGMGNLRSVLNALEHIGADASLVDTPAAAEPADLLILPGVGAFGAAIRRLDELGFAEAIPGLVRRGRPLLGICLGMQLLATTSEEHGLHYGLDLVPGHVSRLQPEGSLRVPHVGWNTLSVVGDDPLLADLPEEPAFYFVHSFEFRPDDPAAITAVTDYGGAVTACVRADGVAGAQFHPEKSQRDGLTLLRSFAAAHERC